MPSVPLPNNGLSLKETILIILYTFFIVLTSWILMDLFDYYTRIPTPWPQPFNVFEWILKNVT